MDKETYEALKRFMSNRFGKKSMQYKQDKEQIKNWINEVDKEYDIFVKRT